MNEDIKATAGNTYVIETNDLTYYYGKHLAVDHVNLKIKAGTIYGFLGRNGAGKSSTIKMLLGFMKPLAGSCSVLGCDSQQLTPEVRQRIGYVTEGHRLFKWMKIGQLEKFQKAFFPGLWNDQLFDEMLAYFELSKKQKIKQLSNGQRAQVSLALTIAPNPELLIMDDPTLGLDVAIRRQFLEGMIQLIQKQGRTILFSSHILSDVERVADHIGVMASGVLRADCTMSAFREGIKKYRFEIEGGIPKDIDLPGLLHTQHNDDCLELVLVNQGASVIETFMHDHGIKKYQEVALNLEDQFIEYTQKTKRPKLFSWEGAL